MAVDTHGRITGAVSRRILEQVGEHEIELCRIGTDLRQVFGQPHLEPGVREHAVDARGDVVHDVVQIAGLEIRCERACFDPAHAQQVGDDSIQPLGFPHHEIDQLRPGRRFIDGSIAKIRHHNTDRSEWGAQVMRHRAQECAALTVDFLEYRKIASVGFETYCV